MKKECVAMLLAGGQGSRLYVLTGDMAKPAVPFGGKFRIIDFPLSNCTNSGIDTVGVLTQYRPLELNSYIGSGQPWELDRLNGGVHILPPYQSASGASWYKGTANAIYQNIGFVDLYDPEYVAVLSGDHIYKMDYSRMLQHHKDAGAACTISVMEVPWAEASRFGIMSVDEHDRITAFAEKPKEPKSNLASMGIYIFTWQKLRAYLLADEADPTSDNDFGIFAGGDAVTGQKFAIDAIAAGKEGAISLHRFVQKATLTIGRNRRQFVELDKENALIPVGFDNTPRQQIGYNEALRRTFRDERIAFTAQQVQKETARCLSCGASVVDPNKCIGCGVCTTKCAFDAIHLHREHPECTHMIPAEDKMKAILPYMVKREIKIRKAGKK